MNPISHYKICRYLCGRTFESPPICVELDLSNDCPCNCSFCYFRDYLLRTGPVNANSEVVKRVLGELAAFGVKSICFTGGGEPLAHPYAMDLIECAAAQGLEVGLVTNGVLMDEQIVQRLVVVPTLKFVRFSINAHDFASYAAMHQPRTGRSFAELLDVARLLVESKPSTLTVGWSYVVCSPLCNEEEWPLEQAVAKAVEVGFGYIQFKPDVCGGPFTVTIPTSDRILVVNSFDRYTLRPLVDKCRATPYIGVVSADFNVYLCCQYRGCTGKTFGNLGEQSFASIWRGTRRREVVLSTDVAQCPPCRYDGYNLILQHAVGEAQHLMFL